MAFEHDHFARFISSSGSSVPCPSYHPPGLLSRPLRPESTDPRPPVMARPPRAKLSEMARDPRRRPALIAQLIKLALFVAWLAHELIVGFDESRCLQSATSPLPSANLPPSSIPDDGPAGVAGGQNPILREPSDGMSRQNGEKMMMEGLENMVEKSREEMGQKRGEEPKPGIKEEPGPGMTASKRHKHRRKVIVRRKLIRKGANNKTKDELEKKNGSTVTRRSNVGGVVRRVVWRMVPLKRVVAETEKGTEPIEEEEKRRQGAMREEPVRTRTGTVVMLRKGRRRVARRRTDKEPQKDGLLRLHPHLFHMQPLSPPPSSPASASVPDQMWALLASSLCLLRAFFDFWALLQCFCSALFLLGLHLRRRLLVLFPTVVDVLSTTLATVFGLSTVLFLLVLILLARSSLLASASLWRCALFSGSVNLATALFAWGTLFELNALGEMPKKRKKQRMAREEEEQMRRRAGRRDE